MISVSKETDLERSKCFSRLYLNGSSCQAQPNKPKFTYSISSQTNYEFCDSYFSQFSEYRCVFFRLVVVVWVFVNVCVCVHGTEIIYVCVFKYYYIPCWGYGAYNNTTIQCIVSKFVTLHNISSLSTRYRFCSSLFLCLTHPPSLPPGFNSFNFFFVYSSCFTVIDVAAVVVVLSVFILISFAFGRL